jgi:hypothetical protein
LAGSSNCRRSAWPNSNKRVYTELGSYADQLRAAVRNNSADAGPIGSSAQTIEVPDPRKQDLLIAGVSLWTGSGGPPQLIPGTSYRMVEPGIHPNDALKFTFQVLRGETKSTGPIEAQVKLMRGEEEIYASRPREVKPGEMITGLYKLDAAIPPGPYLFGVVARTGDHEVTHWVDFEIM